MIELLNDYFLKKVIQLLYRTQVIPTGYHMDLFHNGNPARKETWGDNRICSKYMFLT